MPLIIVAVLTLTALGTSNTTVIVVIGIIFAPLIARTVRSAVLGERELEYVQAARLRGEGPLYIMFAEILPNVYAPILVEFTVRLGYAIFTVASLSFIGYGIQPPLPTGVSQIFEHYANIAERLLDRPLPRRRDRDADHRRQPHGRRRRHGGGPVAPSPSGRRPTGPRETRRPRPWSSGPQARLPRPRPGPRGAPGHLARRRPGRVVRPRRRVRLRQVDGGDGAPSATCPGTAGSPAARSRSRAATSTRCRAPSSGGCARTPSPWSTRTPAPPSTRRS